MILMSCKFSDLLKMRNRFSLLLLKEWATNFFERQLNECRNNSVTVFILPSVFVALPSICYPCILVFVLFIWIVSSYNGEQYE